MGIVAIIAISLAVTLIGIFFQVFIAILRLAVDLVFGLLALLGRGIIAAARGAGEALGRR